MRARRCESVSFISRLGCDFRLQFGLFCTSVHCNLNALVVCTIETVSSQQGAKFEKDKPPRKDKRSMQAFLHSCFSLASFDVGNISDGLAVQRRIELQQQRAWKCESAEWTLQP